VQNGKEILNLTGGDERGFEAIKTSRRPCGHQRRYVFRSACFALVAEWDSFVRSGMSFLEGGYNTNTYQILVS
jgi:hypothetical protein